VFHPTIGYSKDIACIKELVPIKAGKALRFYVTASMYSLFEFIVNICHEEVALFEANIDGLERPYSTILTVVP
jgi:hypothetical protein